MKVCDDYILEIEMDNIKKQKLIVNGREELILDCVENVVGFDEGYVSLSTGMGLVFVEGRDLKIESLSKSDHTVVIKGMVDGVFYSDGKTRKKGLKSILK